MKSFLAVSIVRILKWLPFTLAQALGWTIGSVLYWFPSNIKTETRNNIRRCFSGLNDGLSEDQQEALIKSSLRHTAMAAFEMGHNWCGRPQRNRSRVKQVTGEALLVEARSRVILTPHFGNWELFGSWLAPHTPITAMYKPAKIPAIDKLIIDGRAAYGMEGLASTESSGLKALVKALKRQESIAILPDQEPAPEAGIVANFFGQPAYTMTLASQLANPKGSSAPPQVLLGCARRLGVGKGFAIDLVDISDAMHKPKLQDSVQAMNDAIERLVRQHPEQYQWEYRRFKYTLEGS